MFRLERCVLTLLLLLLLQLTSIDAQFIPGVCAGPDPGPSDGRWRLSTDRLELVTELVDTNTTLEISQTLAPSRDAIALNSAAIGSSVSRSESSL